MPDEPDETVLIARCPEHGLHGQRSECFTCGGPVEQIAMIPAGALGADARALGGDISGPGGPYDQGTVVIDTRHSVLLDGVDVAMIDNPSDTRRFASLLLSGRVNRSSDRTQVLYLFDADGAAALVTELIGLAARERGPYAAEFQRLVDQRLKAMP